MRRVLLVAAWVIAGVGILHACGGQQAINCAPDESVCSDSCAALYKDPSNCGSCGHTCSAGTVCSQGSCATSCGGGTIQCGQSCVDPRVDRDNCGGCSAACMSGLACVAGTCTSTCAEGQSLCVLDGGVAYCAATQSDNANCGTCENRCPSGLVCADGTCSNTCASDQTWCILDGGAPYCAKTASDNENCGACGATCPVGQTCTAGACIVACSTGFTKCGLGCVDTSTDNANCGKCSNVCPMGQTCAGGSCKVVCSPGLTLCGAECVDTTSDLSNCGTCGTSCGGSCTSSRCYVKLSNTGAEIETFSSIATANGAVFWTDGSSVYAVATTSPATTSFVDGPAVGGNNGRYTGVVAGTSPADVYWLDGMEGSDAAGVRHFNSGTPSLLIADPGRLFFPLAVDTSNLYWSGFDWATDAGVMKQAGRDGGVPTQIFAGIVPPVQSIVSDGATLFWSDPKAGTIVSLAISGPDAGASNTVVSGDSPYGIAVDATNLYWTSLGSGYVRQAPKGGGTATNLATVHPGVNIAIDASNVYFIDDGLGTLDKVPIGGGTVVQIADATTIGTLGADTSFTVDTTSVYVVNGIGVYKITPK